ncbi:MAG TPA: MFS transporter, partial [Methanocorpusculum sp.]|nr:MFS transporter [Methanocorpusculum sp.]
MPETKSKTKNNALISAIAGHFIIDLYTPILPIILPFLIEGMGISYFLAGLVVTVFNVVSSITQPFVGIWSDKTGKTANV